MPAQHLSRRQQTVTYAGNGQTVIVQLNKQNLYRDVILRLTCAPTVIAASNSVANTKYGDEWGVVTRVRLVANSSDVLFEASGNDLWWINREMMGNDPPVTPTLGDGITANPSIDSVLILPVWAYRAAKPMDTAYFSGGLQDFRLEVTFGTFTDINSAATAWTTSPSIEVTSNEVEPASFMPPFIQRIVKQTSNASASSSGFRFNLDVGPRYRNFLINARTGSADTAGLITNLKLIQGNTTIREFSEGALRGYGDIRAAYSNGVEFASTGIGSRTKRRISASNDPRAWYSLPMCLDGYLSEAIDSGTRNEFYFEFALSAATEVNVISYQLFPNPLAQR